MTNKNSIDKPLSGIRVLDLSRILAGPYCTQILGDMGAEIIKVERPGAGDDTRTWGPPFAEGESAYYLCLNRNKKSITVDMKKPQGIELIKEFIKVSDVIVENFTPGTMAKFGLEYEKVKEINPKIVYCSISAYGQDGPYMNRPGYDMVLSAVGGLMWITGPKGGEPCKVGVAITDVTTGIYASGAIVASLFWRERSGKGQFIDASLLDAQVSALANIGSNYLVAEQEAKRWGTEHESIAPYQVFPTKDHPVAIAAANQKLWVNLCKVLGREEWVDDPRFVTNPKRVENRAELIPMVAEVMKTRTCDEWVEALVEASVPVGPVNNMERLYNDPQVLHRGMVQKVKHPTIKNLRLSGIPLKYSETPLTIELHPPLLGEHTDEILKDVLSYSDDRIEQLHSDEVI